MTALEPVDVLKVIDHEIEMVAFDVNVTKGKSAIAALAGLKAARAGVATLIEKAEALRPFVQDEANKYADDGSNEPLEALRAFDIALAACRGAQ